VNRRAVWLWVHRVARWVLGGVFLFAGITKLIGLKFTWSAVWLLLTHGESSGIKVLGAIAFRDEIKNYQLGAVWWVIHPAAIFMPWIEIITGLTLICGIWVLESSLMIMAMLVFFNVLVGSAMYRHLDINCGCFGTDMKVGWLKLTENLVLFVLGVVAIIGRRRAGVPRHGGRKLAELVTANTQAV
jgi:hypothetical protein